MQSRVSDLVKTLPLAFEFDNGISAFRMSTNERHDDAEAAEDDAESRRDDVLISILARLTELEKSHKKRPASPSPTDDSNKRPRPSHGDDHEENVAGGSGAKGNSDVVNLAIDEGDRGTPADGHTQSSPAPFAFSMQSEVEIPSLPLQTIPPRILQKPLELTDIQEVLRLAGFDNIVVRDEIRFTLPSNIMGLFKGTVAGSAILRNKESQNRHNSLKAERAFREIIPDLSDGDFIILNHLLFDKLDFRSGIPAYSFKAKLASASLFRTFSITKNSLIQSFQLAYLLAMMLKMSEYSRLDTFIREVYLPMWSNQLLLFYKSIEDIKYAMLPSYCKFLNIHLNKPIVDDMWNLSPENINAIRKAYSQNSRKFSDNQQASSSQSQSFRDSNKGSRSQF